ncbi:MAG TPA: hypothetical protein VIV61_02590 [Candidatus Ozemobacteraceae bacterium]
MAMFVFFRLLAGGICPAEPDGTIAGVFAGTAVRIVEEMGDPKLVPGEVAECVLSRDGRFRLAAAMPGGNFLWTRGTWRDAGGNDTGTDLSFRCDDLSGTLEGRREGKELFLKFSPKPFETQAFRMMLRAPAVEPGDGWPVEASRESSGRGAGIYLCDAFASTSPARLPRCAGRDRSGQAVLALGGDGTLIGGMLAPAPGQEAGEAVLCPIGGRWRMRDGRFVIEPVWGVPRPPASWRDLLFQGSVGNGNPVFTGQTSVGGLPADECRLERVGRIPGPDMAPTGRLALSKLGSVAQVSGTLPWNGDLLPMRVSADHRFLYLRAPDDRQAWLAFPMQVGADGVISVNTDGRCGYLVRGAAGDGWAFVLRSPRRTGTGPEFPSVTVGDLWLVTLDLHWQPIGAARARPAGFARLLLATRAAPEDEREERMAR